MGENPIISMSSVAWLCVGLPDNDSKDSRFHLCALKCLPRKAWFLSRFGGIFVAYKKNGG
jgi:hypothetical protein